MPITQDDRRRLVKFIKRMWRGIEGEPLLHEFIERGAGGIIDARMNEMRVRTDLVGRHLTIQPMLEQIHGTGVGCGLFRIPRDIQLDLDLCHRLAEEIFERALQSLQTGTVWTLNARCVWECLQEPGIHQTQETAPTWLEHLLDDD